MNLIELIDLCESATRSSIRDRPARRSPGEDIMRLYTTPDYDAWKLSQPDDDIPDECPRCGRALPEEPIEPLTCVCGWGERDEPFDE